MTFHNTSGLIELHPAPIPCPCATIITGPTRSGTSMVARVLRGAGMNIGDDYDDVFYEDRVMGHHVNTGCPIDLADAIAHRNKIRQRWAFKRPNLHRHPNWPADGFKNTRMVMILRDPVAMTERAGHSNDLNTNEVLAEQALETCASVAFAISQKNPVLLVSYEKMLTHKQEFISRLLDFVGWSTSDHDIVSRNLISLIQPRPRVLA